MKNRFNHLFPVLLLALMLVLAGCSGKKGAEGTTAAGTTGTAEGTSENGSGGENSLPQADADGAGALRAMYLTDKIGEYLFVGTENGTLFVAPIPEELYGTDGGKLTADELSVGTVVDIYGNNMMLESYPGQYPGVSKMVVVKEGTEADTEPYQYLIDEIYTEPDPSQPPFVDLEYQNGQANVTVILSQGGYSWSYTDENGEEQNVVADSSHILAWDQLVDVTIQEPTDLKLVPSIPFKAVEITRWPVEARDTQGTDVPEGGMLEAVEKDGSFWIDQAEPGYVYLVKGIWENGEAEFGFYTK